MRRAEPIGYCDSCNGPICRRSRWELLRDRLAFKLFMAMPDRIADTFLGWSMMLWLLGYGGAHAFTCICPEKVLDHG